MDFDKHRTAQEFNLDKIKDFLRDNGFTNIQLEQQWRHITGSLEKDSIKQFFKMASSQGVAERTANEFQWNNLINKELNLKFPVLVPRNYESGDYNGLFWFTCQFIDGKPLATASKSNETAVLEKSLSKIASTAKLILEMEIKAKLSNDKKEPEEKKDPKKVFLDRLKHWMSQFDNDANGLYDFIEQNIDSGQQAPSHSDFVPWHIFITNNNDLYLIDGEHSKINGFKFYDVAYFYHRTYTKLKRTDIADSFLQEFNNIYNFDEKDKQCFRLILAQRVIGGYMDAKNDNVTDIELQDELRDRILEDDLELN
jgi:hypothetical protein